MHNQIKNRYCISVGFASLLLLAATNATSAVYERSSLVPVEHFPDSMSPPNTIRNQDPACSELIECTEPTFDFGRLQSGRGRTVAATFTIRNRTNDIVVVRPLHACICTLAKSTHVLLPSQTIEMTVRINLYKLSGRYRRRITLRESAIVLPPLAGRRISQAVQWFESQTVAKRRRLLNVVNFALTNLL